MLVYIDVLTATNTLLGYGPITSAVNVSFSCEMDRAAPFSFSIPATDPQADLLAEKRRIRAYTILGNVRTLLGDGVIDTLAYRSDGAGRWWIDVGGLDGMVSLVGYLAYQLTFSNSATNVPEPPSYGINQLETAANNYSSLDWTFATYGVEPAVVLYGQLQDESVLRGLGILCARAGAHFRYDGLNQLTIFYGWESSGIRAIQANGTLPSDACAIVGTIKKTVESAGILTRIFPRGSGNGSARLDLKACTRSTPSGYTVNTVSGFIQNNAALAAYEDISKFVEFKDIVPISNTDADYEYAANALFDAAKITLDRTLTPGVYYSIQLAGCGVRLKPGQTIHVDYRDAAAGIEINTDLYILKVKSAPSPDGYIVTDITVSTIDQWPINDRDTLTSRIAEGKIYQAHPQLNANSYTTGYTKTMDSSNNAEFRFAFGEEVAQINEVVFEFEILPLESTVKSVAGSSTTTASGGGGTSADAGTHTHSVTLTAHTHTVTIAAHTHTVTIPAHSHSVTVANHTHTVSIAAHSHSVTISSHTHTVSISGHDHGITLQGTSGDPTGTRPFARIVYFDTTDDQFYVDGGGVDQATTTDSGGSATPTTASGGGTTPSTTDGGSQTPTSSSGGGTTTSSTELAAASPTSSSGGSATPTTSSGGGTLETAASAGTHSHTVSAHTHTLTPAITAEYGIFREDPSATFDISSLQYRVNSGAWTGLSTDADDLGDGFYRLDITSLVYNSTTFRPLQPRNILEIRKDPGDIVNRTATIDGLLTVRTIIQANAYT